MSNQSDVPQIERLSNLPNVNTLLKLSLGLIFFTIISTTLIYAEIPSADDIQTECGPGTVLKNNVCELDNGCGPGTVLLNGECVVESISESSSFSKVTGKELIKGIVCAFVISGIIGILLGILAKASKRSH
ncbi:MAG TPA: hypothetical protein QF518_04030 [Nitrosopumilus sp.]|jgi:hypothetical protein|nr:hypothetical protein [Nitrososphaerota archaeon]MDP6327005.1 hypothetical protein [Nitrosopumilus sp.]HJM25753.1 hypothetical protein [Nitrosopumilus sp.]HJO31780.1 hypothetical protein [Nitrosopumilus sp.]|tara:strand:- start:273 stop:665 length:393 start_codon:yes stop_codon:yes gene_type:complete